MSDSTISGGRVGNKSPNVTAMQAGRAKAQAARAALPVISDAAKFAIGQARAASRAANLTVKRLQQGESVSPGVVEACGRLATIAGAELFS